MRVDLMKRLIFSRPAKQFNAWCLLLSYLFKLPKVWGKPIRLMIEPANMCNLQCPTCPVGNGSIEKNKHLMTFDEFKKIIDEAGRFLYHITLWNWGEPFLNSDLSKMIKYARSKGIYVSTSTNGHFFSDKIANELVQSGLNELIVAVDGLSQETLSQYRKGADLDSIVKGVKRVIDFKKEYKSAKPLVELQFIVMKHNEHELSKLNDFASELGVDKVIAKSFGSQLDITKLKEFEPKDKRYSRYSKKMEKNNICKNVWLGMNINADGNVVPCCYDPFEKCLLGNIWENGGVYNIWDGEKMLDLRKQILEDKDKIEICRNCDFNKKISEKKSV